MNKTIQQRRTRARHDPALIRKLLTERQESGETLANLGSRSGIPASTLASWVRRLAIRTPKRSAFVEVIATIPDSPDPDDGSSDTRFEILIPSPNGPRRLLVPTAFDPAALRRLVETLEPPC